MQSFLVILFFFLLFVKLIYSTLFSLLLNTLPFPPFCFSSPSLSYHKPILTYNPPTPLLLPSSFQRGTSVIPKSSTPSRIHQNAALISLSSSETALLDAKHRAAENPKRLARGEAKTKKIMEWTYEEMGWEDREDL